MTIDRIDLEDITARIDELRADRENLADTEADAREAFYYHGGDLAADHPDVTDPHTIPDDGSVQELAEWREAWQELDEWNNAEGDANAEELAELEELIEELRGAGGGDHQWHGDWFPRELINTDDFEEYAEELAGECYDIPDTWPHRCIDWEQAARELAQDYSLVTFRGNDYYWR